MVVLKQQMKVREENDRRKEEWFPNLVTFMVKNLTSTYWLFYHGWAES